MFKTSMLSGTFPIKLVLHMNRTDECATKRVFGYLTLLFIAFTNELLTYFLSCQISRLIRFSLAGFKSFLSS